MRVFFYISLLFITACSEQKPSDKEIIIEKPIQKLKNSVKEKDSIITHECNYKDLSNSFYFETKLKRVINAKEIGSISTVDVTILSKETNSKLDSLNFSSNFLPGHAFEDCDNVRSYITKKNKNKEALDNDYGDFILADFNFDSKEDIAIVNDLGGNGGIFYRFYLQSDNNRFHLNNFLTDSMTYFPAKINLNNKTLITYVHAGVCHLGEHKYQLITNNNYKEISHKMINICK